MTEHRIPRQNWHIKLYAAITAAVSGDTIVVNTLDQVELGQRAHNRMCPDKELSFRPE